MLERRQGWGHRFTPLPGPCRGSHLPATRWPPCPCGHAWQGSQGLGAPLRNERQRKSPGSVMATHQPGAGQPGADSGWGSLSVACPGMTVTCVHPAASPRPAITPNKGGLSSLAFFFFLTFLPEIRAEHLGWEDHQLHLPSQTFPPLSFLPGPRGHGAPHPPGGRAQHINSLGCECSSAGWQSSFTKINSRIQNNLLESLQLAFKPLIKDNTQEKLTPVALLGTL